MRTTNKTIFQRTCIETLEVHSTTKCGMHKLIKLNYFEHSNTFESCKQPGNDNKSSHFIPDMVSFLEIEIQVVFFAKYFRGLLSIHCEVTKKSVMLFCKHVAQKQGS